MPQLARPEPAPGDACPCSAAYAGFRARYSRPSTSSQEYVRRCNTFCDNLRAISRHNADPRSTYVVDLKPLHDLPHAERLAVMPFGYAGPRDKGSDTFATVDAYPADPPAEISWFVQSRVSDIRDQGQCGDCWAESAVAVLEGLYAAQHGQLDQLSVEQAAECTPQERDAGCEGGWPIDALRYAASTGGICTEEGYPTTIGNGQDTACNATLGKTCQRDLKISRVDSVPTGNESMLLRVLGVGVVSVAIDASGQGFYSYASGVYNGMFNGDPDCTTTGLDHAVALIGAGRTVGGTPIWIVRNSWGATQWGRLGGYIIMEQGSNVCGIAQDAVIAS